MKPHYFIFDFDSTLVKVESLDELARIVLKDNPERDQVQQKIEAITRLGMEGKITFAESLSSRLKLFSATKENINELVALLHRNITDSVARHLDFFRTEAERIYVISGGFKEYILPLMPDFGIEGNHVLANTFLFDKEERVTGVDPSNPLAGEKGKVRAVKTLGLTETVHIVGDGYTDYEIRKEGAANDFIAFTENVYREPVVTEADHHVANFEEFLSLVKGFES